MVSEVDEHAPKVRRFRPEYRQFMFENELWGLYELFPPFSDVIKLVPV